MKCVFGYRGKGKILYDRLEKLKQIEEDSVLLSGTQDELVFMREEFPEAEFNVANNTVENVLYSGQCDVIVSSYFHIPRIRWLFFISGTNAELVGCGHELNFLEKLILYAHEVVAFLPSTFLMIAIK